MRQLRKGAECIHDVFVLDMVLNKSPHKKRSTLETHRQTEFLQMSRHLKMPAGDDNSLEGEAVHHNLIVRSNAGVRMNFLTRFLLVFNEVLS